VLYHYLNIRLTDWAGSETVADLPSVLSKPLRDPVFIFGIIFILLVLFFPRGLSGVVERRVRPLRRGLALPARKAP
jgi:branched-chain amino acid transport system permease protein